MCTGLELGLALGSTALSAANQAKANNDQQRIADDARRRADDINRKASQRVSDETQQIKVSNPNAEQQSAQQSFMDALKRAQVQNGGDALTGRGSDRYADDLGLARTAAGAEGARTANVLSRIDAPQLQRTRENVGLANTGTDLQLLQNQSRGNDFLTQLRLARARPDAGIDALASLGGGLALSSAKRMKPPPGRYATGVAPGLVNAFDTSTAGASGIYG